MDTIIFLADRAQKHNVRLLLDPAPARALSADLLAKCAWITPNETEATVLCSPHAGSLEDQEVAELLQRAGSQNIVLKQGARGVIVKQGTQPGVRVNGFSVKAIDTTAAGDAFNGAFACGLLSGKPAQESARFANAVAAISVTRRGAQASMPDLAEVQAFLAQHT
jgi:ribokinase